MEGGQIDAAFHTSIRINVVVTHREVAQVTAAKPSFAARRGQCECFETYVSSLGNEGGENTHGVFFQFTYMR